MKQLVTLIVPFLLVDVSRAQDVESEIEEIRTWFKATELNLKNYTPITLDEEYIEGMNLTVTGYFDPGSQKFVKLTIESLGDWFEETAAYYFNDERLYFSFTTGNNSTEFYSAEELGITDEESFESGPEAKTIEYFEYRHYYNAENCIRYLSKSKTVAASEGAQTLTEIDNNEEDCTKDNVGMLKTDLGDFLTRLRRVMNESK